MTVRIVILQKLFKIEYAYEYGYDYELFKCREIINRFHLVLLQYRVIW
jgi:hypothetical protein